MAYFAPYIDGDGIHIPTYQDILDNLIAGYKRVFGDDIYIGEDTQDYQLLSLLAKSEDDMMALVVQNYNARNPNYATGDALDILVELNAMHRKEATSSKAVLTLTGTPGAIIPVNSQAIDENGHLWSLWTTCTLDENGSGTVDAYCDTKGSIVANAGTINTIYSAVVGWESVTNAEAATPGDDVETDEELKIRRNKSVSMNTNGTYDALVRALSSISGVQFLNVLVNNTGETDSNGIPAHSICVLIYGGKNSAIVDAIWKNKAPGVGTHGSTSINYTDNVGNQTVISFTRPSRYRVNVTVKLTAYSGYDADRCVPIIKNAIANDINALGVGKPWGVTMGYRDIYNGFTEDIPFVVTEITGKTSQMGSASDTLVTCNYNQLLYTDLDHITVTLNE